ncbi:MAG: thioredoxin domain-containing protein [Cryobacterium sp.]|nr:thioredoxin domain-containing protein [Cryobacterium sp.]
MSAKNKKSELREKIAEQREQAAKAAKRRKLFTQLGIVLGALVVVGIIVAIVIVATSGTPDDASGDATPPAGQSAMVTVAGVSVPLEITEQGVKLGNADAPVTIDLFEDFSCPHCKDYEATAGSAFLQVAAEGDAVVNFNHINIVTPYGARGGSMSMCVAEGQPELWTTVHSALFTNQGQSTNTWRTGSFRDFAAQLGVTDQDTLDCIFEGRYMNWVAINTEAALGSGVTGTPSLWINGEQAQLLDSASLIQAVRQLASAGE